MVDKFKYRQIRKRFRRSHEFQKFLRLMSCNESAIVLVTGFSTFGVYKTIGTFGILQIVSTRRYLTRNPRSACELFLKVNENGG
ncbi:MAG: hypothetical protein DI535_16075 [Citrobacter freundii]|nr:MAG: hypothetical protein DI535_16075 [Citrobacter freundii]